MVIKQGNHVKRMKISIQNQDTRQQRHIPDPVHNKSLFIGLHRLFTREPKANEQVGCKTHQLPKHIQQQQVIHHHQTQHGKTKETEISKIAAVFFIALHVCDGINMHRQSNTRNQQQHQYRKVVQPYPRTHLQLARRKP